MDDLRSKPESYWREKLTPEQYKVLREGETEIPYISDYWDFNERGMYRCAACGEPLFASDDKYVSGTGWPSFFKPVDMEKIETREDTSLGMKRTEVRCKRCGSHLGHVFDDAPEEYRGAQTTGQRFCINACSLDFKGGEGKNE